MTAVDDAIANLQRNRFAEGDQAIVMDVDTLIAAFQQLAGMAPAAASISPVSNGRLTLTTGVPYLSADVTAAASLFFTPANGNKLLLFGGTTFTAATFTEQTLSIAALAANTVYDIFGIDNGASGVSLISQAWASATARSVALARVQGVLLNAGAIGATPAERATYLGTIATDAATRCNMMMVPAGVAGGSSNRLDVWNYYNRAVVVSTNIDATAAQWSYDGLAYRAKNNNVNNAITFVVGVSEDGLHAVNIASANISATTTVGMPGIGLDSSTAKATQSGQGMSQPANGATAYGQSELRIPAPIGRHFVCPIEQGVNGAGNVTWNGQGAGAGYEVVSTFTLQLPM